MAKTMERRKALLARLRQTPLGFGGAPIGNLFRAVGDEEAVAMVRHAWDAGIRYFDTAPLYGCGLSEHRVGQALRECRDDAIVSSKVGRLLIADADAPRDIEGYVDVLPFALRFDYSYDGALRSIEDTLQRLGVARLDIVYIHDVDRGTHGDLQPDRFAQAMDGAAAALARLRDEGSIEGFGLGVNDWTVCVDALQACDPDVFLLAGRYTLLDQSALPTLLPLCTAGGVGVVVGGPFNSGILATGATPADGSLPRFDYQPAPAPLRARVARMERLCATYGVPLQAAALQFPRGHPAVVAVVAGARSRTELDQNLEYARFPIPTPCWRALRSEGLLDAEAPLPG